MDYPNVLPLKNTISDEWYVNPLTSEWALRALIDFTLSNARRFYSSMARGNPLDGKGFKVQVKLCTSMNLFSRMREGEKLKWIKQWFDYLIEKTNIQVNKRYTYWNFACPQHFWQILKRQPRKVPATFAANSSQTTDVYINKPICWQYLTHVVSIDSSCTWLVLSVGTFFKAS